MNWHFYNIHSNGAQAEVSSVFRGIMALNLDKKQGQGSVRLVAQWLALVPHSEENLGLTP